MRHPVCVLALCVLVSACGNDNKPSENIPNYGGSWRGTYVISGCNQSGGIALANICGNLGSSAPYTFALTQSSRNVSGSFALGNITFPNTGGSVAQDGSLALTGTTVSNGITIVVNWALTLPSTAISGTLTQRWTSDTLSGVANVVGTISTALHNTAVLAPAPVQFHSMTDVIAGATTEP